MNTLKTLRIKKGLTLRQLSKELELPFTTLHSYESGFRQPSFEVADRIAAFFGVPIEEIFPRYKRRSPYPKNTAKVG